MLSNSFPSKSPGRVPAVNGFGVRLSDTQSIARVPESLTTPSTHMHVQFRDEYVDEEAMERKRLLNKSNSDNLASVLPNSDGRDNLSIIITNKVSQYREKMKSLDGAKAPLTSSFKLPSVYAINQPPGLDITRNMLGRSDVACQTDFNLTKVPLGGLSEYQRWASDEVEPFLKELRKAIKSQKPSNLEDFCVEYCYARAAGRPMPEVPER